MRLCECVYENDMLIFLCKLCFYEYLCGFMNMFLRECTNDIICVYGCISMRICEMSQIKNYG